MICQYGGCRAAFAAPVFYVETGGNLGAAVVGTIGFIEGGKLGMVVGAPFGPAGVAIGGGAGAVVGGAIGGALGYFGGAVLTDWRLKPFARVLLWDETRRD